MISTTREEMAWAAGFFDGEGHVGRSVGTFRGGTTRRDLYLSVSQIDRRVLDRFRDAVGCGKVDGPYVHRVMQQRGNEQPRYYFQTARFEYVQAVVAALWAFLSPVKRAQARDALVAIRSRSTHQRACTHGHPRTPENTYISKDKRHCRICRLDDQKRLRLVRKTAIALLTA